jgi:mitogen-activated protein kinase 7
VQDQLNLIFSLLGTPQDEDMGFLERDDARSYIRCFEKREGQGIRTMFEHAHEDAVAVLENVLRFDPRARPTIDELLDFDLFTDDRDASKEVVADAKIDLGFEAATHLDEFRLRSCFLKEIAAYSRPAAVGGA